MNYLLLEYDDIDKPDEGLNKVFPRESISFRIEIQATTIQRWRGTLSSSGNKLQEIMISYIASKSKPLLYILLYHKFDIEEYKLYRDKELELIR